MWRLVLLKTNFSLIVLKKEAEKVTKNNVRIYLPTDNKLLVSDMKKKWGHGRLEIKREKN